MEKHQAKKEKSDAISVWMWGGVGWGGGIYDEAASTFFKCRAVLVFRFFLEEHLLAAQHGSLLSRLPSGVSLPPSLASFSRSLALFESSERMSSLSATPAPAACPLWKSKGSTAQTFFIPYVIYIYVYIRIQCFHLTETKP